MYAYALVRLFGGVGAFPMILVNVFNFMFHNFSSRFLNFLCYSTLSVEFIAFILSKRKLSWYFHGVG